jgi:hypothetical protein
MKNKSTFATFLTIAVLVLSLGLVSAASLTISNIQSPSEVLSTDTSFQITFDLNNSGNETNLNWSNSIATLGEITSFAFSKDYINASETLNIQATINIPSGQSGPIGGIINAGVVNGSGSDKNLTFSVSITEAETPLCLRNGSLRISEFSVNNLGNGADDEWQPLDGLEIEAEIENIDNSESVSDVLTEIFIFDSNGNDVTNDFDITDEEIDLGRIKDDDQEIVVFEIKELPGDIEEGEFRIYIKAYSEDDEVGQCVSESGDFDNNDGNDFYHEFDVLREDDPAVVVKSSDLGLNFQASCGDQNVEISFPIYNIGTDKEDKVLVNLYNSLLGINEFIEIDNLKEGKEKRISFLIDIPEELSLERYYLDIITYFEYDDGEELDTLSYDSNSEEDLENGDFNIRLEILGCSGPDPSVGADLISEAIVGKELRISALITNNGEENEFDFTLSDIEGWAELVSISPGSSTIGEGETIEILITLNPLKEGPQTFELNTISNGEIYDQSISVNVAEGKGISIGDLSDLTKYLASAIVALIILIFVTLIVKISRKPSKAEF